MAWKVLFHRELVEDFAKEGPGMAGVIAESFGRMTSKPGFQQRGKQWGPEPGYKYFGISPWLVVCSLDEQQEAIIVLAVIREDEKFDPLRK